MAVKTLFQKTNWLSGVILLLTIYSCKEETSTNLQDDNTAVTISEIVTNNYSLEDTAIEVQDPVYKYVNAPSGLNFRDAPDGEILGKFPLNLRVQIIDSTGIYKTVQDEAKTLTGEWVKVRVDQTSGFVFSGFLTDQETKVDYSSFENELSVLTINGYEIGDRKIAAFISLTDGYWANNFPKLIAEYQEDLENENHGKELYYYLKGKERAKFLSNRDIKETDKLYIYNYLTGDLKVNEVKNVPLFSHENIYGGPDYLTGFDVKDIVETSNNNYYNSFAVIGTSNPFKVAGTTDIKWEKISFGKVPNIELEYGTFYKSKDYDLMLAYHDVIDENHYYYTRNSFEEGIIEDYIFIISKNGKLLYKTKIYDSESATPSLYLSEYLSNKQLQPVHFTGLFFKDKPPVIFGLYYNSFGCPFIDFLSDTEPSVYIQCDNRH